MVAKGIFNLCEIFFAVKLFGDHSMHGPEGVRFYTKLKTATVTWSEDDSGPEFTIPVLS